ncbi:retrovirus-related pol polyprotein from transposon TNT 1-94 [Tanacetum coccineum]
MHEDYEYVKSLEKEVDELESEKADFSNIYDLLLEECVSKDVTCSYLHSLSDLNAYAELQCLYLHKVKECECLAQKFSKQTESVNKEVHNKLLKSFAKLENHLISLELALQQLNHTTSVSRPQLKCYQVKDKVVPNNSQVKFKKKEVEDHHRISSISKKTKSVTVCNDSSNSKTSNVNAILPISASKPKRKANKSVATPHKKTVASDTTIQKSKSYYKELYENTNQEWKWWIAKRCPSGYTWTQKPLRTKKIWMPKIRKDDESTSISPTIDIVSRITNVLKISNSLGSNLSNVPSSSNSLADCTVHFGDDQFAPILSYGDPNQGNATIKRVYYVEGLNHNLFSVGQFCDADLEVAFRKSTCFVRDLQGNDLLTASPTQAWLWHRRLSHLNFDYITLLSKETKRSSFKSKVVPSSKGRLNLLHMDLCGPMRVASINGKKYILVIIDDYSRYTWTLFLRSKDETPEVLKHFLTMIQCNFQAQVISVRTDRGTEFLNKTLHAYFKEKGIEHQTSTPQTPEQNGVVKRRNRTLVEAARTMLSAF